MLSWDQIQQVVRIVLYSGGGYLFGESVADGQMFQSAVGGLMSVGAFAWWLIWDRQRP